MLGIIVILSVHIILQTEISDSLQKYEVLAKEQEERWIQEIEECDELLQHTHDGMHFVPYFWKLTLLNLFDIAN